MIVACVVSSWIVFLYPVIKRVHTPLRLQSFWNDSECRNQKNVLVSLLSKQTLKHINYFSTRCIQVCLGWVESKWIWPQPCSPQPRDSIIAVLLPLKKKRAVKVAAHWIHSGGDGRVWTRVQPNCHVSSLCLVQLLALCWTWNWEAVGKTNWSQQGATRPLLRSSTCAGY